MRLVTFSMMFAFIGAFAFADEDNMSLLSDIIDRTTSQNNTDVRRIDTVMANVAASLPTHVIIKNASGEKDEAIFGNIDASVEVLLSASSSRATEDQRPYTNPNAATYLRASIGDVGTFLLGASLDSASNVAVLGQKSEDRDLISANAAFSEGIRDAHISISATGYEISSSRKSTNVIGAQAEGSNVIFSGRDN